MEKKKNEKKYMRFRHRVIRDLAFLILGPITRFKCHVKVERFKEQGDRPYLILMNHQTAWDQFFVGMAFRGPVYYMATEDIFSLGLISKLLRWAVAPIPIKKQTTDISAVMTCIRLAREGGTIALAPEGNRTYHGRTVYMNPAIVKMAKKMKLPIALFRIEDGYGIQPRWADGTRKGTMTARVSRVIEPEEYAAMKNDELFSIIQQELSADEELVPGRLMVHEDQVGPVPLLPEPPYLHMAFEPGDGGQDHEGDMPDDSVPQAHISLFFLFLFHKYLPPACPWAGKKNGCFPYCTS